MEGRQTYAIPCQTYAEAQPVRKWVGRVGKEHRADTFRSVTTDINEQITCPLPLLLYAARSVRISRFIDNVIHTVAMRRLWSAQAALEQVEVASLGPDHLWNGRQRNR